MRKPGAWARHSAASRVLTPSISFANSASKLPAQASIIRCRLSLATSALVSRYFKARNGHSNRFTLVSMMPGAWGALATAAPRATVWAVTGCAPAKETAAALSIECFKKLRRSMGFMSRVLESRPASGCSEFNFQTFLAEDGCAAPRKIPAEDFHPMGLGNTASQALARSGGVAAPGAVPAPHEPVHAQFPERVFDHAGMRIRSGEFQEDVLVGPDGAHAQLPVATGMAADQRNLREPLRQLRQIHRRRFGWTVVAAWQPRRAPALEPGVEVDVHFQFRREPQDRIVVGMTAGDPRLRAAPILDSDAGAVADPLLDLGAAFVRKPRVDGGAPGEPVF